jgi:hypothetical protein
MRHFLLPSVLSVLVLAGIFFVLGPWAFLTAVLLTVLEVTLSFDNAVVNARVLEGMHRVWQKRFLTWGMLIAVFGTRLLLPILIVAVSAWASPFEIAKLAILSPVAYGELLGNAKVAIHSFGAAFLLMVALKYFFNATKELHWLSAIERRLTTWGRIEAIEIGIALATIVVFSYLVPADQGTILSSGIVGILLYIVMQGFANAFAQNVEKSSAAGLSLFIYLNVLDSAFSLDSVVGAFALTTAIPVIVVGLGIGAYFVRSLTMYFVEKRTLRSLIYLEHGAHWAIFALAASMFAGLLLEVPEIITGGIGVVFVAAAYWSSVRIKR